jgi:transcriptional regulator with XRE-family HTH domain
MLSKVGIQSKTYWEVQERYMHNYAEWFAKRLRDVLGDMSQTELIEIMKENGYEIKAGRLSHYMQGRNYPDPDALAAIAKAIGVSVDYLLGLTEEKTPVEELKEKLAIAKGEGQVDKILAILSKEQRAQVLTYAEYLSIQPSPGMTTRQREQLEMLNILNSIERNYTPAVRREVEQVLRGRGLPVDGDT